MSEFWNEFKDLFKTTNQKEEEKNKEINKALGNESALINELEKLDKSYKDYAKSKEVDIDLEKLFPSNLGLEEITYTPKTDEEILGLASSEIKKNKNNDLNKLENNYQNKLENFENNKELAQENLKDSYEKLKNVYDDLKKNAENNSIKRGLQRSSIIMNQINDLSKSHMLSAGEVEKAYNDTISTIDLNIGKLESDKELAYESLDLKYADELNKKIDELKSERQDMIDKYQKYNNNVREKNTKYESEREQDVNDYLNKLENEKLETSAKQREYESKYGYSGEKQKNYSKRYDLAFDFYTSLSPDIAVQALQASPNMKYYLGNYYNKLINVLKSNESTSKKYY